MTGKKKKSYYKSPTPLEKVRHRLADGTPTAELLRYMHSRKKLPKDVRQIAEAAERMSEVRRLLKEVIGDSGVETVAGATGIDLGEFNKACAQMANTDIGNFMAEARKALMLKTMKQPKEV